MCEVRVLICMTSIGGLPFGDFTHMQLHRLQRLRRLFRWRPHTAETATEKISADTVTDSSRLRWGQPRLGTIETIRFCFEMAKVH